MGLFRWHFFSLNRSKKISLRENKILPDGERFGFHCRIHSVLGGFCLILRSVFDFLVEDRCILCGKPNETSLDSGETGGLFVSGLAKAVPIRLFRLIPLENHPVCVPCLAGFEETKNAGIIGRISAEGVITTADGSRFPLTSDKVTDPADPIPTGCRPVLRQRELLVFAPFMTNDSVLQLIHMVKFSGHTELIPPIAGTIREAVKRYFRDESGMDVLVPVPMEQKKERLRGFNQSERIGRELSERMGIPLDTRTLKRSRRGDRQSQVPREKRASNVRGAYTAIGGSLSGKNVFLVDDLVTSGSTVAACASALLASGAVSVVVLCFGRSL